MNALAGAAGLLERNAAHGGFGFLFDARLAFGFAAPPGKGEALFDGLLEFLVIGGLVGIRFAERERAVEERLLDFCELLHHSRGNSLLRDERFAFFAGAIAARQHYRAFGDVFGAEFQAQRDAAHFPIVEFEAGAGAFALVELDADSGVHQFLAQPVRAFQDTGFFFVRLKNRDDYQLDGRQARRENQSLVITMHHDDGANEAGGEAPGSGPAVLQHAAFIEVANFERFREVLAEIVGGAGLQRFAVAHHGFDGEGLVGAGETLGVGFASGNYRDGGFLPGEIRVDVQHLAGFEFGFGQRGVRGVAFLPEKLQRSQEELGAQFPAHHAVPLIDQQRQVAVGLNPLGVSVADDGFRRRTNHQRFFQFFAAAVGHYREFRRKSGYVRFFFFDEAARNQQRERGVDVAGGFEAAIERRRDVLP